MNNRLIYNIITDELAIMTYSIEAKTYGSYWCALSSKYLRLLNIALHLKLRMSNNPYSINRYDINIYMSESFPSGCYAITLFQNRTFTNERELYIEDVLCEVRKDIVIKKKEYNLYDDLKKFVPNVSKEIKDKEILGMVTNVISQI